MVAGGLDVVQVEKRGEFLPSEVTQSSPHSVAEVFRILGLEVDVVHPEDLLDGVGAVLRNYRLPSAGLSSDQFLQQLHTELGTEHVEKPLLAPNIF